MATVPQLPPGFYDQTRELWYAGQMISSNATTAGPYERKPGESDEEWFTDAAYILSYPDAAPKIDPNDEAAVQAWLRIRELVRAGLKSKAEDAPSQPDWTPSKVTWPLPTAPKKWRAGGAFGAKRPAIGTQTRYHTGTDLAAPPGLTVYAPEDGVVVAPNSGWESKKDPKTGEWKGVKSIIIQTDSGHTVLLGGIRPDSATVAAGERVTAGQKVAEVGTYPLGDSMLHVQLYDGSLSESQVNARKSWWLGNPPPSKLLDPTDYLLGAMQNPKAMAVLAIPVNENPFPSEESEGTPAGDPDNTKDTAPPNAVPTPAPNPTPNPGPAPPPAPGPTLSGSASTVALGLGLALVGLFLFGRR